jgi:hypothetical protein
MGLLAKARERLRGTEAELIAWLRGLGVPVADNLTIEERVRIGILRAYDRRRRATGRLAAAQPWRAHDQLI